MSNDRKIIKFVAATGFTVVLEFRNEPEMMEYINKIEDAGLKCQTLDSFHLYFDQADLFMDMRSMECREQFDIDDWI